MSYPLIQIRGTSGSGKSTLIRQVMERFLAESNPLQGVRGKVMLHHSPPAKKYIEKRKQPVAYVLRRDRGLAIQQHAFVLGHYETACGGCDTLPSYDCIRDMALHYSGYGPVLFEGLLMSGDVKYTKQLAEQRKLHVVFLDTKIDQCLENIGKRRAERGDDRPLKPDNTVSKDRLCQKLITRLPQEDSSIEVSVLGFDAAVAHVVNLLLNARSDA